MMFLNLDLADGSQRKFQTVAAFEHWLRETEAEWRWFTSSSAHQGVRTQIARQAIADFFRNSQAAIATATENPEAAAEQLRTQSQNLFVLGVPLDNSDPAISGLTTHAKNLSKATLDEMVGAVIFCDRIISPSPAPFNIHQAEPLGPAATFAMSYAAAARRPGPGAKQAAASRALAGAVDRTLALASDGEAAISKFGVDSAALSEQLKEGAQRLFSDVDERTGNSINAIDATRVRYEEVMRLKAPVDYWDSRAEVHNTTVRTYRRWLTGAAITLIPVLGAIYWLGWAALENYSENTNESNVAFTIYVAGFVASVTAVFLWFIRIIVRLYMSQHHLKLDAEGRASMLRTYLALVEGGNVTEKERALVLTSVFRPTPDGIVKDDGAPSMSPSGLLASLLDKKD